MLRPRGRPAQRPVQLAEAFKNLEIQMEASGKPEIGSKWAQLSEFCAGLCAGPFAEISKIQAAMMVMLVGWNEGAVLQSEIQAIFNHSNWPRELATPTDQTVSAFAVGTRPADAISVASYLYLIHLFTSANHPCFWGGVPSVVLSHVGSLSPFRAILGLPDHSNISNSSQDIISLGAALYKFLGINVTPDFSKVKNSHIFSLSSDSSLVGSPLFTEPFNDRRVCAIRYGVSGRFVASSLRFSVINSTDNIQYLYVATYTEGEDGPRAHGFVIPREGGVFIVQYHLNGVGLSIISVSYKQLRDKGYSNGLILTIDRGRDRALAARIVLAPELDGQSFMNDYANKSDLFDGLDLLQISAYNKNVLKYLRDGGSKTIEVRPGNNGEESVDYETWNEFKNDLSHQDLRSKLGSGDQSHIFGYSTGALVADE